MRHRMMNLAFAALAAGAWCAPARDSPYWIAWASLPANGESLKNRAPRVSKGFRRGA